MKILLCRRKNNYTKEDLQNWNYYRDDCGLPEELHFVEMVFSAYAYQ